MFNYECWAAWVVGASSRSVDTVEDVLGRGCVIPSPGWRKSGPGEQVLSGDVVERRRGRSFWVAAQAAAWMSRRSQDRRRKSGAIARAARTTSSLRMVSVEGACERQRDVRGRRIFVVKALPAVTTRGGSAWQTSKGVFPTGARASKKRAGSVDGVGRKAGSRGNEARITDRRTEADEVNYLANPPQSS